MEMKLIFITAMLALALAMSGCTMPGASPSPTPTPTPLPTATAAPTVNASTPTPVPASPTPTATPTPTPHPEYSNGAPVSISNVKIHWDTSGYDDQAKETATMTLNNLNKDNLVLDVAVIYEVSTPTTIVDAMGNTQNLTNTVSKTQNIGVVQWEDQKDLTFQIDHSKIMPETVSVIVKWRGGQATVFQQTLNLTDHSAGTYEF